MALELNGTTGVSLVQDGVVTSAKIADGAISAADLASNAITSAKLADDAVTVDKLPAGTVLQVQQVYHTSSTRLDHAGGPAELSSNLRIAFTPKQATSKLIFNVSGSFCCPNSTHLHHAKIYDITNSATVAEPPASSSRERCHWTTRVTNYDSNDMHHMCFTVVDDASNTTARTYTVYFRTEGVTVQFLKSTLNTASGFVAPLVFTITEVAQ